jgi:hypothetical protein
VLPGAGSLMCGRRVGWLQAALALAGFVLTMAWLVSLVLAWVRAGEISLDVGLDLRVGLAGIAVFGAAWLWSLASSLDAIRRARRGGSS